MTKEKFGKFNAGWYNIYEQEDDSKWGINNGCAMGAWLIPIETENEMKVCDGECFMDEVEVAISNKEW